MRSNMLQIHGRFSPTWYKRPIHVSLLNVYLHVHLDRGPPLTWPNSGDNKIVICQVPTKGGRYADYKLIALFDKTIFYLEGGTVLQ